MHTYCRRLEMKWTWMMLLLGTSLAGTCSGWMYHHSSTTMNWTQARQWCRKTYTDMVVIQNQDENDKLVSVLPNKTSSPYYWLGLTRTREDWTWVGNNSTWMSEESWAENEPNNNRSVTVCVEIYVNNGDNRGKWNDEKCRQKKYAVCYQAQCNDTICGPGRCREVANNFTCLSDAGLQGNTSHTAEQTPNDTMLAETSFPSTSHSEQTPDDIVLAGTSFPSTSHSEQTPNDTVLAGTSLPSAFHSVNCTHLSHPNGYLSCSDGNHTVNSTCRFKCHRGFLMIGSPEVTCGATGAWSSPGPACARYKTILMALAGFCAFTVCCCFCICGLMNRRRKPRKVRLTEEATRPPSELET